MSKTAEILFGPLYTLILKAVSFTIIKICKQYAHGRVRNVHIRAMRHYSTASQKGSWQTLEQTMRARCSKFYIFNGQMLTRGQIPWSIKENGFCQQHWSGEWVEGISYLTNMKFLIYVMDSPRNWYEIKKMYLTLLSQTLKNYWAGFLTLYTARKKKTSTMMWVEQLAGRNAKACPNSLWTFQCEWCGSQ